MTAKTTMIVTAVFNPEQMPAAQEYMQQAIPMLISGGGEVIRRLKVSRALIGEQQYNAILVMDFPSENDVSAVFESEAYAKIIPLRKTGFKSMDVLIASSM